MDEEYWLEGANCEEMLEFLRDKASDRNLRQFAVGCCPRKWGLLTDERSQRAVNVAEMFAEGVISEQEFDNARWRACDALDGFSEHAIRTPEVLAQVAAAEAACSVCWDDSHPTDEEAYGAARATSQCCLRAVGHLGADAAAQEKSAHFALLRCVFRNPFRPVTFDPSRRSSTVNQMAESIYQERAFDRLAILADALEDAGCTSDDILTHCRGGGEHCRGCWPLDLVLGKE